MAVTSLYRKLAFEADKIRVALGWPQEKFSEFAGIADRSYGKYLHPDSSSGRQANWETIDTILNALCPEGYDVEIRRKPAPAFSAENLKAKLLHLRATENPATLRDLMKKLGHAGRAQQLAKQSPKKREKIARRAAKMRWRKWRRIERMHAVKAASISAVIPEMPKGAEGSDRMVRRNKTQESKHGKK